MFNVGVIGAGSFGTAIAQIVARNVDKVYLHVRRKTVLDSINDLNVNSEYYPNIKLLDNIVATMDLNDLSKCQVIFLSVPSSAFRQTLQDLKNIISNDVILVSTAKGIEYPSLKTMGKVIEDYFDNEYVVLSGPNFASEIILDLPTISNIASSNSESVEIIKNIITTDQFKVKIIEDIVGLEICGIVKNINAIANGICEGMGINENARYSILTKGFEDTVKIIESIGGNPLTASEYCGFGDLVLTSTSSESRNHTLGMLYGQRLIIDEKASGIVFEGKNSILAIKKICDNNNINSVIVNFVHDILIEQKVPNLAFGELWENIED